MKQAPRNGAPVELMRVGPKLKALKAELREA